jgi:hypothetical protein
VGTAAMRDFNSPYVGLGSDSVIRRCRPNVRFAPESGPPVCALMSTRPKRAARWRAERHVLIRQNENPDPSTTGVLDPVRPLAVALLRSCGQRSPLTQLRELTSAPGSLGRQRLGVERAPLWGRARRLVAVTAIDIGVGDAHSASLIRAGTGVPLPWCPRSVLLGNITRVDVWIDIGLCIRRHHPGGWSQNAHACDNDQSAFHRLPPFGRNKCGAK